MGIFWRMGHFAWFFDHSMSQWVKLRGGFFALKFGADSSIGLLPFFMLRVYFNAKKNPQNESLVIHSILVSLEEIYYYEGFILGFSTLIKLI